MIVKTKLKLYALAALVGSSSVTLADSAKTLGGLVVQSDDGNFIFSLGGRVHFDYTGIQADDSSHFDSGAAENNSGFYFRRIFISLAGKIYDWRYRIDEDISNANNPGAGLQDAYIARDLGDYGTIRGGQTKPWRSMDELLSNNDKIFTERNVISANGILGGRDYQLGLFYRVNHLNTFTSHDNMWAGASVYSLNKAGATTDQGTGTPTQGIGYNARLAYAPLLRDRTWAHVGASFSSDHADNGARLTAGYSTWYSYKGIAQNIVSFAGNQPATIPSVAKINGGDNPNVTTLLAELAGAIGPLYLQAEAGQARFEQDTALIANARNSQTVDAYSVEASYYITGESKKYDPSIASLSASPAPLHPFGALEIATRYDRIENRDLQTGNTTVCAPAVGTIPTGTTITRCAISSVTAGVNYYVNRNVRFMLDYSLGKYDLGAAGTDKPGAVNARFQIAF
jgi:phosphate-selective porin OprO/OprP